MNKNIDAILATMSETDFCEIRFRIQIADWCRSVMKTYELNDTDMAKRLGLSMAVFKRFKTAAYNSSLEDWARLQAFEMELGIEAFKEKVKKRIDVVDNSPGKEVKK